MLFAWFSIGVVVVFVLGTAFTIKVTSRAMYIKTRPGQSVEAQRARVTHLFIIVMAVLAVVVIGIGALVLS